MFKNVGVLTLGTGVSQAINLFGLLFLSRLYTPTDFGVYAVLLGAVTIAGAVSSFRYEMTILLPKVERAASLAARLSVSLSLVTNIVFFLIVLVLYLSDILSSYWILAPVAALFTSFINIAVFLQNRKQQYTRIVLLQILKALAFVGIAATAGYFGATDYGLLLGLLLSVTLPSIVIIVLDFRHSKVLFRASKLPLLVKWAIIHKKFAYFSTPAVFASTLAAQAPVFLLSIFFGQSLAGYYTMVQKVMIAPVTLISGAFNKVYMQRVSSLRARRAEIFPFTVGLIRKFIAPGLMIAIVMSTAFWMNLLELAFGDKWVSIDDYALAMVPAFLFSFIAKSISGFSVLGRNELGLIYQVLLLISITLSVWLGYAMGVTGYAVFLMISIALLLCYIGQSISILRISKHLDTKLTLPR